MQERVKLFGVQIDPLRMPEAVSTLMGWIHTNREDICKYVVTPNVDHTLMIQQSERFRNVYADAHLVLADGMPVVLASRLLRRRIPERVTGADLVPSLFAAATEEQPLRVYLLGAGPGVGERAAKNIETRWPSVSVVGTYSPPFGFENDKAENESILEKINAVKPDVLVVGLGAPKQEFWVHEHREALQARVAFCVGATIDFLANEKPRAPLWMQRFGLEWLHRLGSEPRRLFKRYAHDAWVFPQLVWQEWRTPTV